MSHVSISRRTLLAAGGAVAVAGAWLGGALRGRPDSVRALDPHQRRTMAAAQARILPSDVSGPGATEVAATTFLEQALLDPTVPAIRAVFLKKGLTDLDRWARRHGAGDFLTLRPTTQDEALRAFSCTDRGHRWVYIVTTYTLEAFLGDPVRGANPDKVGWRHAHHTPGWPVPSDRGWRPTERTS